MPLSYSLFHNSSNIAIKSFLTIYTRSKSSSFIPPESFRRCEYMQRRLTPGNRRIDTYRLSVRFILPLSDLPKLEAFNKPKGVLVKFYYQGLVAFGFSLYFLKAA